MFVSFSCSLVASVFLIVGANASDWQEVSGGRARSLDVASEGKVGFTLLPPSETGITFSNTLPQSVSITNQILLDGSGVAAGDVDDDGRCDLYFCAIDGSNKLYRNVGGLRFEDITAQAGVDCKGLRSTGAALADLDGDRDLDLVINTAGNGTHLFYNDGQGRFKKWPAVLNPKRGGKTIAVADVDGDGWLDLYLVNYRVSALMDVLQARFTFKVVNGRQTVATFNGRPTTDPEIADRFEIGPMGDFQENGEADLMLRNSTGTNFIPVSFTGGNFLDEDGNPLQRPPLDWGLTAAFRDLNGDGLPDIYVCNDFQTPDRLWLNRGHGKFQMAPRVAARHTSISSMSVDFADINHDGLDDFIVLDMMDRKHADRMCFLSTSYILKHPPGYFEDRPQYEFNTLFLNRGDMTFTEIAQLSGLEAANWAWSGIFLDVDLDGWEDLLVVTGMERDGRDLDVLALLKTLRAQRQPSDQEVLKVRMTYPSKADGNLAFRNRRDLTFEEVSQAWGFAEKGVNSAMALADLDADGDLDVVVSSLNGPARVFRNETSAPRVAIRLKGESPNTKGIGARIWLRGGAVPEQSQEMICGGRYVSSDEALRCFAVGEKPGPMSLQVSWRDGRESLFTNVLPNCIYEVDQAQARWPQSVDSNTAAAVGFQRQPTRMPPSPPLFADVSRYLNHTHQQQRFDDFTRQTLLPHKLSQLGPGLAWLDLDADGRDDLVIGGATGGTMGVFLNRGSRGFEPAYLPKLSTPLPRGQTGLVGWLGCTNYPTLLAGVSNYEDGRTEGPGVISYSFGDGGSEPIVEADESAVGPLAMADLDGTGSICLFVGGRVIPGRYPEPASSRMFRLKNSRWEIDEQHSRLFANVGLVSGAIFTDLTGDGFPELVLASEWAPVRVFLNEGGHLKAWDPELVWPAGENRPNAARLSDLAGWWNGVTAADFDGDGRLDLALSNWGRNTKYEMHRREPLRLFYGPLSGDDTVQIVEAYFDPDTSKIVPARQLNSLAKGLPWLRGRYGSYREFSTVSVQEMLAERMKGAKELQASWFDSTVLLNRGDSFEVRTLPIEAQMAPAFGITAADFDSDGCEDLFLAQNFFDTQPETARYDGGVGLLLKGEGHGLFKALSGDESGIKIYGEQRGAATSDFDGDGRVDLAVSQNGTTTKLYQNHSERAGLRVKLLGPEFNASGYGAVLRLRSGQHWSAAKEIHAAGGYWSQDSAVQVIGGLEAPEEMEVLWPGGKKTTHTITSRAREVTLSVNGRTQVTQ
jgi:hypothetical protein